MDPLCPKYAALTATFEKNNTVHPLNPIKLINVSMSKLRPDTTISKTKNINAVIIPPIIPPKDAATTILLKVFAATS